jgi:hypothetical protein
MLKKFAYLCLPLVLAGCFGFGDDSNESGSSDVSQSIALSQNTKEIIAKCGAGISSSVGAKIEAKIGQTLQEGGKIDGGLYNDLEAAFIKNASVDNASASAAFQAYIGCINGAS